MHALIPLLLILILFNRRQLETDKLYRANVFALVGISYFFLFQYTIYWYRIFPTNSALQFVPGIAVVLSTVAAALSPWNKRSSPIKTALLCFAGGAVMVATIGFDHAIKEKLAELGGYFESGTIAQSELTSSASKQMTNIGIQLNLSGSWSEKTLDSGHTYFILEDDAGDVAELRPNCLGSFDIDTPTFVRNTLELFEAGTDGTKEAVRCTRAQNTKECLVVVRYADSIEAKEKWRWFKMQQGGSRAVVIDVLISADAPKLRANIVAVLASAVPMDSKPSEPCRTPAAWL